MGSAVRKIGNSMGVILPKPVLESLGAKLGDTLEFIAEDGVVRVETRRRKVRDGWEEDARALAASGLSEEEAAWLDADLTDDSDPLLLGSDWSDEEVAELETALKVNDGGRP